MEKCIIYIGEFDMRNENVQAHLVKNNGRIFTSLGYKVVYIGVNREKNSFKEIQTLPPIATDENCLYYELPNSLNAAGVLKCGIVCRYILHIFSVLREKYDIAYIISYQSPTYAIAIKKIAIWCRKKCVKYIVNCADLPIFELQSPFKKFVMKVNWKFLHRWNKKYADGVISVSRFIDDFYYKKGRSSVIVPPLFDSDNFVFSTQPNEITTFIYAGLPFVITNREASPKGMKDRLDKIIDLFLTLSGTGVPYVFKVIGISKEDYLAGVPRHTNALKNEKQIRFLGKFNHEETLSAVAAADFSINYRDENLMTKAGFSTKIVESVSLGTPVVINPIGDTFCYLETGVSGFALCENSNANVDLLRQLCEKNADERWQMKRKCYEKHTFSTEAYKCDIQNFLNSLRKEI